MVSRISQDFVSKRFAVLNNLSGRKMKISSKTYPLISSNSYGNGLELKLKSNQDINRFSLCRYWEFIVHSPYELPNAANDVDICEFHYGVDLDVLITPEIIYTDKDLRSYEPKKRGCYFKDEKKLKYFKVYTRKNCEFECLSSSLYEKLNCTPFYYVRDDSDPLCDHRQEVYVQYYKQTVLQGLNDRLSSCECLEECDSVKYNIEIFERRRSDYNQTLDLDEV